MKFLKILLLSSTLLFANCSLINDKFISKSNKNKKSQEEEVAKDENNKLPEEEELVVERVYIEDEKEKKDGEIQEGLRGDSEFQNNTEYPNLADVPTRPDPAISLEEQEDIVRNLENNSQLEPVPSETVIEDRVSNLETSFNQEEEKVRNKKKKYRNINPSDTVASIRDVQLSKLNEIQSFKPSAKNLNNENVTEEEKELHDLARGLKDIKTADEVNKVEEKIKKNDLYYTPDDIEEILGLKVSRVDKVKELPKKPIINKKEIEKKKDTQETTIIDKKMDVKEVPVARVTFNHGSSQLSDEDLRKIKEVANLFMQNEGKKIVIVGHSSSRTNYDMDLTKHALVNFNMSLERARKVMRQFSTIGMNSQTIELVAMSDAEPLYAEIMPSLEAANRRAEIFIQY
ncbi:MAG: OmpA family protein [Alphaproteobacteria bacterium]|nr:OmpA family protein [Alphaproteobacteria bacterium]